MARQEYTPQAPREEWVPEHASDGTRRSRERSTETVSYTHLTLPTILLV